MTSAFQFSIDEEGIAKVVFDLPGEKVNKFNRAVCKELDSLLDSLMNRKDIKALLFISGKKDIFIAGADLKEFLAAFKDPSMTHRAFGSGAQNASQVKIPSLFRRSLSSMGFAWEGGLSLPFFAPIALSQTIRKLRSLFRKQPSEYFPAGAALRRHPV